MEQLRLEKSKLEEINGRMQASYEDLLRQFKEKDGRLQQLESMVRNWEQVSSGSAN